jgi:hypothetical protein
MSLIKSRKRVADHGKVFTRPSMAEAMLDLVNDEPERIDSRFVEPACGAGTSSSASCSAISPSSKAYPSMTVSELAAAGASSKDAA